MLEQEIKIPASLAAGYVIKIGTDILGTLWPRIEDDFTGYNKFVITDENLVSAGHLQKLLGQRDVPKFIISPAGETSKNIDTAISIIEAMEKVYLGRDTLVIALGGGTVGDIAGFAAAIFKRGVPVLQIPTTTVAQADSSAKTDSHSDDSIGTAVQDLVPANIGTGILLGGRSLTTRD